MIAIEKYTNPTDAYKAKQLLELNGISTQLRTDTLSSTSPSGYIELLVAAKDAKLARDVLANAIDED